MQTPFMQMKGLYMVRIGVILDHIKTDCEDIFDFVNDMTLEDFINNKLVRNAVGMSLISIGELVKTLPTEYREGHPERPHLHSCNFYEGNDYL